MIERTRRLDPPVDATAPAEPSLPALDLAPTISEPVGLVLGTEDSTPLQFWVGVGEGSYLQLDDAVILETEVPGHRDGPDQRHRPGGPRPPRGAEPSTPTRSSSSAASSRPRPARRRWSSRPGSSPRCSSRRCRAGPSKRARGRDRDEALYFDRMTRRLPAGLSRDGEPVYLDVDFLDGTRGAHVNISGISGVATKTTYALFLLYALFHSEALGAYATNTKAIVFNVKGEDLLWLDRPNALLDDDGPGRVRAARAAGRAVRLGRAVGAAATGCRGLGWRRRRRAAPRSPRSRAGPRA